MYNTNLDSETAAASRTNVVALILRLSLAAVFLFHGLDKIINGYGGTTWVNEMYQRDVGKLPSASSFETLAGTQLLVSWGEFLGGLALLAGLLTRWAALGEIIIQLGAVCLVTAPRGFHFERGGGYEYNIALISMCLALLILGAGKWSVDWALRQRRLRAARTTMSAPSMQLAGPHVASGEPAEHVKPGTTS
jgi:putative oxidoreductase